MRKSSGFTHVTIETEVDIDKETIFDFLEKCSVSELEEVYAYLHEELERDDTAIFTVATAEDYLKRARILDYCPSMSLTELETRLTMVL